MRRYLREFLGDRRVVDVPRVPWWLILHLFVLPIRARRSARLYAKIWSRDGSPLLHTSERIAAGIAQRLNRLTGHPVPVALGMRYGRPMLTSALRSLQASGCKKIIVLPLYPQYSATTVGSTFDATAGELAAWRHIPNLRFVSGYHQDPGYISALVTSIREFWDENGRADRLLLSFHGLPRRYADAGDPYPEQCEETARLMAGALGLPEHAWTMTYQSRFGRKPWLQPYTDETLRRWGREKLPSVDVVCPGFAADCLETLEEIALRNRHFFREAGGGAYRYIPALNDRPDHIAALSRIIEPSL